MIDSLETAQQVKQKAFLEQIELAADQNAPSLVRPPHHQATALLSHVLAYLPGIEVPVIQFIKVSGEDPSSTVARDFAYASLAWLGRTLLVTLYDTKSAVKLPARALDTIPATGKRRKPPSLPDQTDIVPDAEVPELYHARISWATTDSATATRVRPSEWLGEARSDFRVLVISCGSLSGNPGAVELASRCHGSILAVCAGQTSLSDIQATSRQLQLAGGRLLGTVLYKAEAPGKRSFCGRTFGTPHASSKSR